MTEINMLNHEAYLNKYASFNKDATRFKDFDKDLRGHYFRDIDRIIHSLSYTRYIDKTQVFSINDNDNISKRIIHVTLVSKIARTISRGLNLNEDLTEAIALGHDLGHVPFGHVGEKFLDELSQKYTNTYFLHNIQSVRTLMDIEDKNLTIQTLDGIMCHNGEIPLGKYYCQPKKDWNQFWSEYEESYLKKEKVKELVPMTLEGCVVRISDLIAYLGRDIEDGIRVGLIKKEDIPLKIKQVLGETNSKIIDTIIKDIIKNSLNKNYISLSNDIFEAIKELQKFNYENIYYKAYTNEEKEQLKIILNTLFEKYLNDLKTNNKESNIIKSYLNNMKEIYHKNTSERIVIDYIAGMTDDYCLKEYNKILEIKHNKNEV